MILEHDATDEAIERAAKALRAAGDVANAIPLLETLARRRPSSYVFEHNLSAAYGDAGRAHESEAAAYRAISKGSKAPETHLVLARARMALGDLEGADASFRDALALRPDYLAAIRDRIQLIWMQAGDPLAIRDALAPLTALAAHRLDAALLLASILRDTAGDKASLDSLRPWLGRGSVDVFLAAAAAASRIDSGLALHYARAGEALAPEDLRTSLAVAASLIATGDPKEAAERLDRHLLRDPGDQHARALRYTAWRMTGHPGALSASDYEMMVRVFPLRSAQDQGWLNRTAAALRRLHPFQAHPFQQSVLGGSQTVVDPRFAGDPDLDRLFDDLAEPIAAYLTEGAPIWGDRPGGTAWTFAGAWSVMLRAGGRHSDHVHPRAWVSSAVYIVTPDAPRSDNREGWLRFGAAPIGPDQSLPPEHWVRPEPGKVVLFPSYLWHGTEPFTGPGERLTVAFDLKPAATT